MKDTYALPLPNGHSPLNPMLHTCKGANSNYEDIPSAYFHTPGNSIPWITLIASDSYFSPAQSPLLHAILLDVTRCDSPTKSHRNDTLIGQRRVAVLQRREESVDGHFRLTVSSYPARGGVFSIETSGAIPLFTFVTPTARGEGCF